MPRLPKLWTDSDAELDANNWGQLLKDYLSVALNTDGSLKTTVLAGTSLSLSQTLTFTTSQGNGCIIFPDPTAGNSNPLLWKDAGGLWPQLKSNSAASGLTMTTTTGAFVFSVLRQDIAAGTRELGRVTFEGANALGNAFRPGYIYVSQTDNTNNAESGYLGIFTRSSGSDSERMRIGDLPTAAIRIMDTSLQLLVEYNSTNKIMIQHNGTNGYIGTQTNQPFILRQNNADAITVTAAGNITLNSYGSGTGAVTVGAADSGGTGFRLLRVPN